MRTSSTRLALVLGIAIASVAPRTELRGQSGTFHTTGTGCPLFSCSSRAIYENMPAMGWDLDGTTITLSPGASAYTASHLGAPISLTAPIDVLFSPGRPGSIVGPFPLGFRMPTPGGLGSTSAVDIFSTGYVFLESGVIQDTSYNLWNGFLTRVPAVSVFGNSLAPIAGQIKYQSTTGSNPRTGVVERVFVVEWRDAWGRQPNPITLHTGQCQLWESGDIAISHESTPGGSAPFPGLIGLSPGGGEPMCGQIDFTNQLPYSPMPPFSERRPIELSLLQAHPNLGHPLDIEASNVPSGADLGILLLGSSSANIPLGALGFPPGCSLLIDQVYASVSMRLFPGVATASLAIPNRASLAGLRLECQAFFVVPAQAISHAVPVYGSDRGTIVIGRQAGNDACVNAYTVTEGLTSGDNYYSTSSGLSPTCSSGNAVRSDVWFKFTSTRSGTATVDFCSAGASTAVLSTGVVAFTGVCGSLTEVACSQFGCPAPTSASVSFPVSQGVTYHILVGSFSGPSTGPFVMFLSVF